MIFIGLGSSIGNASEIFDKTETYLKDHGVEIFKKSKVLVNPPQGGVAQNEFHNAVWQINFPRTKWEKINWVLLPRSRKLKLKAFKLLKILQACEKDAGRTRNIKWADRTLDLDILQFHDFACKTKTLTVPHPEIPNRDFVLKPWREIVSENYKIPLT